MGKMKKSIDFYETAAAEAEERQDRIVAEAHKKAAAATTSAIKPGPKKAGEESTEELVQMTIYVPKSYRKKIRQIALDEERTISDIARGLFERLFEETEQ